MIGVLIFTALVVYIAIARFVMRRMPGKKLKYIIAVVFVLIPIWDEIIGRIYLGYLCRNDAGIRIYQTMRLPAEYVDADGNLNIFNQQGFLNRDFWLKNLDESGGVTERYSSVFNIGKDKSTVVYKKGNVLLAEITTFRYWGGWIRAHFIPNNAANSCAFIRAPSFSREFYGSLFNRLK